LLQNIDYEKYNVDLLLITKGGEFEKFVPKQVNIIFKNITDKSNSLSHFVNRIQFYLLNKINKSYNSHHIFWTVFKKNITNHEKKYDVAVAYSQGFATYFVAEKVMANKKFSWLNIDYAKAKHNSNFDHKRYLKYDKIVCVSPECETSLIKSMKNIGATLPTMVIKDITDTNTVRELSLQKNGFLKKDKVTYILTVGRLAKQKGLHLAIDACNILKNKGINITWFVIGEGTERQYLETKIKEKNLIDSFVLLGFKENPYPFMKTCDIYVQTSLFEGLGLTVIEAAIFKKPIVTTNFPTASSIVTHNETGLICDMTGEAIAESIQKYLEDDVFKNQIIDNLSKVKNTDKEKSLKKFNELMDS
jgi:glycosyltransferase involved in cell wall biosynthesis